MALSISDICIVFARKGGRAYDGVDAKPPLAHFVLTLEAGKHP